MIELDIFGSGAKEIIDYFGRFDSPTEDEVFAQDFSKVLRVENIVYNFKKEFSARISFSDGDSGIIKEVIRTIEPNLKYSVLGGYFPSHVDLTVGIIFDPRFVGSEYEHGVVI